MMKITKAEFLISCPDIKHCPDNELPEIALIGRSNVGKSSFINTLTNRKKLAYTSNTPGKTRLINLYQIEDRVIIADLPGYGYAKVPKKEQESWGRNLEEYILNRKNLKCAIQFIDTRHEVQKNDLQMREWLNYHKISVITVATKADAISKNKLSGAIRQISETLHSEVIGFSAKTGMGKEKILKLMFN